MAWSIFTLIILIILFAIATISLVICACWVLGISNTVDKPRKPLTVFLISFTLLVVLATHVTQPKYKILKPKVVGTYTLRDVVVKSDLVEPISIDLQAWHYLTKEELYDIFNKTKQSYTGGKIILRDKTMTEYEIDEVLQTSTVTEPTFKRIKYERIMINKQEFDSAYLRLNLNKNMYPYKKYKVYLYMPPDSKSLEERTRTDN